MVFAIAEMDLDEQERKFFGDHHAEESMTDHPSKRPRV